MWDVVGGGECARAVYLHPTQHASRRCARGSVQGWLPSEAAEAVSSLAPGFSPPTQVLRLPHGQHRVGLTIRFTRWEGMHQLALCAR